MGDVVEETRAAVGAFADLHRLLPSGATVVVAVSGGPDSVCLLDCLQALAAPRGLLLHVAHLDHMLRADGSAQEDAAYVRDLAARYGLEITCDRRDVRALMRQARLSSIQAAARQARYDFLAQVADSLAEARGDAAGRGDDTVLVATGHTANDQAETVLLHLLRGSGLAGLAGMPPRRGRLVRPLLAVEREAVEAYCTALGLAPRQDPSNSSRAYTRNRLRHDLLPTLRRYNPRAGAALARAAASLAEDLAYLEGEAARLLPSLIAAPVDGDEDAGTLTIDGHAWRATPRALRAHLVRAMIARLYGTTEGFDHDHITRVRQILDGAGDDEYAGVARAREGQTHAQFPRRLRVERRAHRFRLSVGRLPAPVIAPQRLAVPGSIVLPGGRLSAEVYDADDVPADAYMKVGTPVAGAQIASGDAAAAGGQCPTRHKEPSVAYVDAESAGPELVVRGRRPGDAVRPLGMGGHRKKLQDLLVDAGVPRDARDGVPIVARVDRTTPGKDEVVWVAGYCLAEPFKVTASTRQVVCLRWAPL
jgi:tRNA(Ile)-lysidine synthase